VVVRDADPTTPINTSSGTGWQISDFTTNPVSSGSLTTGSGDAGDGALLLYGFTFDGTDMYCRTESDDIIELGKSIGDGTLSSIVGYRTQSSVGAAPTTTGYAASTGEGGTKWVLAIKNKSGGSRAGDCRPGITDIKWYGSIGNAHQAVTWQSLNNFAATVNSISTDTVAPSVSNTFSLGTWNTATYVETNVSTASLWVGGTHTISSTDMTGKVFSFEWQTSVSATGAQNGTEGVLVGFSDGTNWVTYRIARASELVQNNVVYSQIALGAATAYASSGSINWAAVTRVAYLHHRGGSSSSFTTYIIKNAALLGTAVLTGGGEDNPASFLTVDSAIKSWGRRGVVSVQGVGQVLLKAKVQIGDGGTNKTYFDASATSAEYPKAFSTDQIIWNANANSVGVTVNAGSTDTVNFTACIVASDLEQPITVDSASSTSATYSFNGASFVGLAPTCKTGVNVSGATFSECSEIDAKGSDWTDCTIKKTISTDAAIAFSEDGGSMTRCTIDVTGTSAAYHIELGTATTALTLTDVTFTGTPGTDKVHVRKTTGTVTITISGSTSLVAGDVTSEGATVVISAPQLYQSVTVSNLVAGSRVQIYDTASSTELSNTTPAGTSVTWTDSVAAVDSRDIRVRITKVSGATAYEMVEANIGTCGITEGTESVSYLANQVADTTYNTNAIDGSTVTNITINDTTNKVEIAIPGGAVTWPQIYAYQVYWLNTSTGIQDDFAFIEAPDTANYLLTGFIIKNTSSPSVPLVISSGYGRDSTTGASVDLVDTTGGTLIFAPDHVVAFSTGSGLTAGQDANLSAIKAKTDSLAFTVAGQVDANIQYVNDVQVTGTGETGSEWGPA
jgi:hypothetical protein